MKEEAKNYSKQAQGDTPVLKGAEGCCEYEIMVLSEPESALLAEHLKTCEACRNFALFAQAVIDCPPAVGDTPPLPLVYVRAPQKRSARRIWYSVGAAALVVCAVVFTQVSPQQVTEEEPFTV